jgi:hypothetical protein
LEGSFGSSPLQGCCPESLSIIVFSKFFEKQNERIFGSSPSKLLPFKVQKKKLEKKIMFFFEN